MREEDRYIAEQLFAYNCSWLANSGLADDSFKKIQEQARANCMDLLHLVRPWEVKQAAAQREHEVTELRNAFKQLVGDLDDPNWVAAQKREIEKWNKALAEREVAVDPAQLLASRQQERLNRLRELDQERRQRRR